jgi:hypothetical protein
MCAWPQDDSFEVRVKADGHPSVVEVSYTVELSAAGPHAGPLTWTCVQKAQRNVADWSANACIPTHRSVVRAKVTARPKESETSCVTWYYEPTPRDVQDRDEKWDKKTAALSLTCVSIGAAVAIVLLVVAAHYLLSAVAGDSANAVAMRLATCTGLGLLGLAVLVGAVGSFTAVMQSRTLLAPELGVEQSDAAAREGLPPPWVFFATVVALAFFAAWIATNAVDQTERYLPPASEWMPSGSGSTATTPPPTVSSTP